MAPSTPWISVKVGALYEPLKALAEKNDRSMSAEVRRAIVAYLAQQEKAAA